MTESERADMRYWPFEEFSTPERSLKRIRNGMTDLGIRWAVMGASGYIAGINGYSQIPWEGHPWTGCDDYDKLDVSVHGGLTYGPKPEFDFGARAEELYEMTKDTDHPLPKPPEGLSAHPAKEFADVGGWVGFDTQHAHDVWTDEELAVVGLERKRLPGLEWPIGSITERYSIVWTLEMVISQALSLANQIAEVGLRAKVKT